MTPIQHDPYSNASRNRWIGVAIGSFALIVLLILGIGANINLRQTKEDPVSVLKSSTSGSSSILPQTSGDTTPVLGIESNDLPAVLPQVSNENPVLAQTVPEDTQMPDDVRAWLEHLQKIEAFRVEMTTNQLSEMMTTFAQLQASKVTGAIEGILGEEGGESTSDPSSKQNLHGQADTTRQRWKALLAEFRKLPPPSECVPIATSYEECLGETSAMIFEILNALESSDNDPQAAVASLIKMQGTSSSRIDKLANTSDRQLGAICDKYKTRKWFSITSDVGGGMMGKLGGLGF